MPSRPAPTHGRHRRRRRSRLSARLASRWGLLLIVPVALATLATTGALAFPGAPPPLQPVQSIADQVLGTSTSASGSTTPTTAPGTTSSDPSPTATNTTATDTTGTGPTTTSSSTSSAGPSTSTATSTSSRPMPPPGPTDWGSSVRAYGNETYQQAFDRVQQRLHPQVIRFFDNGTNGPAWPSKTGNSPLVISFKILPAQVLNGSHDAQLRSFFAATPRKTFWSYWHEPEDDIERGAFTAAQYRAAWAHIAAIAKASGRPLVATLILMGWSTQPASHRTWTDYYPGSDVVDVLAWDCYATTSSATPQSMYGNARADSVAAGKPWAIAETAASKSKFPDPSTRKAMLTSMSRWLADSNPKPVFVTYFDSDNDGRPNANISLDQGTSDAWVSGESG